MQRAARVESVTDCFHRRRAHSAHRHGCCRRHGLRAAVRNRGLPEPSALVNWNLQARKRSPVDRHTADFERHILRSSLAQIFRAARDLVRYRRFWRGFLRIMRGFSRFRNFQSARDSNSGPLIINIGMVALVDDAQATWHQAKMLV